MEKDKCSGEGASPIWRENASFEKFPCTCWKEGREVKRGRGWVIKGEAERERKAVIVG